MELKKLQSDRKRIVKVSVSKEDGEVEFLDLAIWHKPLTPALADEIDAIEGEKMERLTRQLELILTRWDLTDGGAEVKPTQASMNGFEFEFLHAIRDAIFEPVYPKKAT